VTWCGERDRLRTRFLESAGFADDGGRRRMDSGPGTPAVVQVRFSADLD
jgi:hypothetical protein